MKYPIGVQDFESIRTGGYVYVDKTDLVYKLVTSGKVYFLSRPRRFGKSLLVSTLKCYFEGRKELFNGLAIDKLEKEWNKYPVFYLSFGGQNFVEPYQLDHVLEEFVAHGEKLYGKDEFAQTLGSRFKQVLKNAQVKTGRKAVVLIDEYDKPLLDVLDMESFKVTIGENEMTIEDYNRNLLKGFFSVLKEAEGNLQFVLLTGVTKFSQVSVFSGMNQPDDISMSARYDTICGITENELQAIFQEPIEEMAQIYGIGKNEMKHRLKRKFNGYHFSRRMVGVYNPFSILRTFNELLIDDYWFSTGSPTYLIRLLAKSNENLNELVGKYYSTQQFVDYKADAEEPLPMIYQSGYLTIKGYDMDTNSYLLDFPNDEVKNGFVTMAATSYLAPKENPNSWLLQTVKALRDGNTDLLDKLLTSFLASIPYSQRRKDNEREKERYFQYTFYLLLRMVSCFTVFIEKETSEGRSDCVVETPNFIYIFEFKRDGKAEDAVQQIDTMGYAKEYETDARPVIKIGCNFSSKTGTVDGWKVVR